MERSSLKSRRDGSHDSDSRQKSIVPDETGLEQTGLQWCLAPCREFLVVQSRMCINYIKSFTFEAITVPIRRIVSQLPDKRPVSTPLVGNGSRLWSVRSENEISVQVGQGHE
jgi:hypothetical protein